LAGLGCDATICASQVAGMTGMYHCIQSLVEMGVSVNFLLNLYISVSQVSRITGLRLWLA
jgi:hypothetical protein